MSDQTGAVYRLSKSGKLDTLLSNGASPNGLVLTPNEKVGYFFLFFVLANESWTFRCYTLLWLERTVFGDAPFMLMVQQPKLANSVSIIPTVSPAPASVLAVHVHKSLITLDGAFTEEISSIIRYCRSRWSNGRFRRKSIHLPPIPTIHLCRLAPRNTYSENRTSRRARDQYH